MDIPGTSGTGDKDKDHEGIDCSLGCSYIVDQAECSDMEDEEDTEEGGSTEDFVDDAAVDNAAGEHLSLLQTQMRASDAQQIASLKRKYVKSPHLVQQEIIALSPKLEQCSLQRQVNKKARKQLFLDDSGISETGTDLETTQVEGCNDAHADLDRLFDERSRVLYMYRRFNDMYGVKYTDLIRAFKSDKTMSANWVVVCYVPLLEDGKAAAKHTLQQQCSWYFMEDRAGIQLFNVEFNAQKCRATVIKLFTKLFNFSSKRLMADPPKLRSAPACLFWYQKVLKKVGASYGELPDYIHTQCALGSGHVPVFELTKMVQWALDNNLTEESSIALKYAMLAEEDENAQAFLKSNNQPKLVKDCCTMVRMFQTALMRDMSISQYVDHRCNEVTEQVGEEWRSIVHFLRYQGVQFLSFMIDLKNLLHHKPKKCTIVVCGPPNTGKSYFVLSFVKFMNGCVISFVNYGSHFWLTPLRTARIGMIDDATNSFWKYCDTYMRTLLDGNDVSIDCKHRNPIQLRCPPLVITTNEDIKNDPQYKYLQTRLRFLYFNKPFPLHDRGDPVYKIESLQWASFFRKFWRHLDLTPLEEDTHGETATPLRLYTRENTDSL
ncbi:E1 [Erethizon dorsatum papillomavirus 1]|uniref:Replication protein E1 n=1 Tax=Erethizon dorsatum papillomavirus 1 TaxID=291590 RepID=Q5IRF4_9PAPI|nr:E1 [Erethizon dorsatum papillomavirus 1]AAU11495.1 E1 [Erethizon dorsatum papillomavirus 1]UUA80625.1 E1 [Erethizon dorsatum papillomavirus 1]WCD67582.1 E1 protein [Erethizon dorsatum papillomavirus 1]